jgi:uncharacterized membrane protein
MDTLFLTQLLVSFFLCGLIWIVQLVHYPSFKYIDKDVFVKFEVFHTRNISLIVVPAMIIELVTALLLFTSQPQSDIYILINLILVILIWIATLVFSMPYHNKLSKSKDIKSINKLINTNWLRTAIWSTKSLLLLWIFLR